MSETAGKPEETESTTQAPSKAVAAVNRFAAAHEGARAVVQFVGDGATRITLIGTEGGVLGDVLVPDVAAAEAVIAASDAEAAEWDRELAGSLTLPAGLRKRMAGHLAR
ncbi:MAG: hypothetical protein ABI251_15325 [Mycobacteriaceae bacterium]